MRLRYTGMVERIQRQPCRRGETYPTLIHVKTEIGSMTFQAAPDCEDVTGRLVTVTLDVDEAREERTCPAENCGLRVNSSDGTCGNHPGVEFEQER